MSDLWINLGVVLLFILIGGFFASAELALVSLRESQVQRLVPEGRRGRRLLELTSNPNRFLAAVQVAVTLAGFVSAGFGAAQIAPQLAPVLMGWGLGESAADIVSFVVVTVAIAYASLVLGELVPKRIALQRTERVALFVAAPVDFIAHAFRPFIWALSVTTNAIVRVLGIDPTVGKEAISGEELRDLVAAHEDLTKEERDLIDDVFAAGDRELREVMLPRTEVAFLEASLRVSDATTVVVAQPHSRYPVIKGSADDVIGFVHIRDILDPAHRDVPVRVGQLAREITSFPGTNAVLGTLTEMRRLRQHLAIVQDEYGGTAGIVTMEDLVEELIGDIQDEYDIEGPEHEVATLGVVTVAGLLNIEDFAEETGVHVPDGPYETVAGFVISLLGRVPLLGDTVTADGHVFEVVELDGLRVSRVRVTHEPDDEAEAEGPAEGESSGATE